MSLAPSSRTPQHPLTSTGMLPGNPGIQTYTNLALTPYLMALGNGCANLINGSWTHLHYSQALRPLAGGARQRPAECV